MKTISLFFISVLFCCRLFAQSVCMEDSIKYLAAYNHIIQENIDKSKYIAVSDSIVDLDRFWFAQDMEKYPVERETVNQYRANKGYKWFEPYYSDCINFLVLENDSCAKDILFFSQIEDNILVADIFPLNRYNPYKKVSDKFNYGMMAFQNMSRIYLFIFDHNSTIKAVFSREMIYD